ncbi:hypothetical protein OU575_04920 [Escherichia coli]|nr:hypothetical protein [Escherichia coli]MDF8562225.1 hypothetical protein [Escherichia coli]
MSDTIKSSLKSGYHPQYDTERPWFEHTDDGLTEHGHECPYVRPERREILLIKRLRQFVPDALTTAEGDILQGITDENGKTAPVNTSIPSVVKVEFGKVKIHGETE